MFHCGGMRGLMYGLLGFVCLLLLAGNAGAAQLYVQQLKLRDVPVRFDIVEVRVEPGTRPAFEIISNAYAARR